MRFKWSMFLVLVAIAIVGSGCDGSRLMDWMVEKPAASALVFAILISFAGLIPGVGPMVAMFLGLVFKNFKDLAEKEANKHLAEEVKKAGGNANVALRKLSTGALSNKILAESLGDKDSAVGVIPGAQIGARIMTRFAARRARKALANQ